MRITPNTEMTLRAVVDGKELGKVKLPDPIELTRNEAEAIAVWARPFSGTCLTDLDVHVSDIRPSSGLMVLSDLNDKIARRIRPMLIIARKFGFGLRVMRDTASDPYSIEIFRRVVDVPQLTIPWRSMEAFLEAMGYLNLRDDEPRRREESEDEAKVSLDSFSERLATKGDACMDAGVAHYRDFCLRIVEYGRANNATEIVWGPERRGAVETAEQPRAA